MDSTTYIAADHRGYALKQQLRDASYIDLTPDMTPGDDYPEVADRMVVAMQEPTTRGILLCGSGAGIAIAANRHRGIRAAVGLTPIQVMAARRDDDINILVIAADFTTQQDAREMIEAFHNTPFSGEERHLRRIQEMDKML